MRLRESAQALASRCSAEILAGRYRLDARIGSGGAADVHRGFDLRLRRAVAVKLFRPGTGLESEEGFASEAVILARLQHPGLVTAYDAGRHDGRAYLVMQLIEGPTLRARIAGGALSCEETAELGAGLAQALAHAHEAGIVHRDVKPSNILLGASGRPYLTDFGISRLVDATTRTVTGTIVGTAAYLSPEQVLGQSVGRPADIYALGLVLLECLTGRLEYGGGPLEAAIARLHRPPVLPGDLPNDLVALLRDMTALDEQTRPSALDCARTLAALADSPLSAPAARTTLTTPTAPAASFVRDSSAQGSVVQGPERAHDEDATHPNASPAPGRAAPKAAPARNRVLVAGGTVALVTVMAAALAATDVFPHHGGDGNTTQAASSPAAPAHPENGSAGRDDASATPVAPPAPTHDTSEGPLRSVGAVPGSTSPNPVDATGIPAHNASDTGAQAVTQPTTPDKQSSKSEKAAKAQKAAQKSAKAKQKQQNKDE